MNPYKRKRHLGLDPISKLKRKAIRNTGHIVSVMATTLVILAMVLIIMTHATVTEVPEYIIPDVCELEVVECEQRTLQIVGEPTQEDLKMAYREDYLVNVIK